MIIKPVPGAEGLYRGDRPTDFGLIEELGIKTILNLENEAEAMDAEAMMAKACQIACYYELPMSEWSRPTFSQLIQALQIILHCEKPMLIHCLHGYDRTGYVIAAYRIIVQGWSVDRAYKECIAEGHKWLWYWWWKRSLKEIITSGRIAA